MLGSVGLRGQSTFCGLCWGCVRRPKMTAAEVMFGMPLNLPGEMHEETDSSSGAEQLAGLPVWPRS
jgi:hypothetical protein